MSEATVVVRSANGALPQPIRRMLRRLERRLRTSAFFRGLGTTALVIVAGAALGMATDFAWELPQAVRWCFWCVWLAAGLLAIVLTVLRPTVRRFGALDLAAVAERSHPELGEHLTGAVGLLGGGTPAHGSPALIAALADQAAKRAGTVEPSRAISWHRAARRLGAGLLALGLLAAPIKIWPHSYGTLARRFLAPWADLDRVGRYVLSVAPGDRVIAIGSDLTVSTSVHSRIFTTSAPRSAWLEWSAHGETRIHRVAMPAATNPAATAASAVPSDASASASAAGDFAATLPKITRSLSYRVESGRVTSRWYRITAVEPPAVMAITARVRPPEYTRLPVTHSGDAARIDAFEGSRVTLEITPTRPVRSIEVDWPVEQGAPSGQGKVMASLPSDGSTGLVTVEAWASGPLAIALCDVHDIASRPEAPRRVVVRPDAPPVVAVRGMEGLKEAGPIDVLGIAVAARDDIAVASVELHYAIVRSGSARAEPEAGHVAVPAPGLGSPVARGKAELPLDPLALQAGDALSYRIRVADNRPAPRGPNVVWSPFQVLTIVAAAEPLQVRRSLAKRAALRAQLEAVRKAVAADRGATEQIRQAALASRRGSGDWDKARQRALDERETAARAVEDRLALLSRDLAISPRLQPLARAARQISEVEAEAVRASLEKARQDSDPARRLADVDQALGRLSALKERLDDLARKFGELNQSEPARRSLRELAERQAQIAANVEDVGSRAVLDRLQAEQNAVRGDLDALLKKAPELRSSVLDARTQEAERLAREARALAQRQREESRQATDLSKQGGALKVLADAQRALEDDARRLAVEVNHALAENGRGRLNAEAIRQAVEPIERGEIEQARERLDSAENELRRLARDLEDTPTDPKALAGRLFRRQDALNRDIDDALRAVHDQKLNADEKAEFATRMKALAQRQQEIATLTKTIQPAAGKEARGRFPHDAARDAVQKTTRAALVLPAGKASEINDRKHEARQALERLANDLQDAWHRQELTRQKFQEARRISNEVSNEIAQHLRETNPRPDHPATTASAAEELARRLHDTADKQARAVTALEEMEPEPRVEPQRARAARRARSLAGTLRDLGDPNKRERARSVLAGFEVQAHAAMDRLEQKQNGQVPADDLAAELAGDARALHHEATLPPEHEGALDRARMAEAERILGGALRNLNVPDAALEQAEAVRRAERAAHALADPNAKTDAKAALHEAVGAAQALADRLADRRSPRDRAATLARAQRALNDPECQADPVDAALTQRAIAEELARLPLPKKDAATGHVSHASELAGRALSHEDDRPAAGQPTPAALAAARAAAANALDELAALAAQPDPGPLRAEAKPSAPADPELGLSPAHVAAAHDLVKRERHIREQLQAMLGERALPQQALRRESSALGREVADLREQVRPLSARAQHPAQEAAQHLGVHAPLAMDQGARHLSQGQARNAREAQRRASELAERGAQHAEDFAAALRAERQEAGPAAARGADAAGRTAPESRLASARQAMRQAARQLSQARDPALASQAVPAAQRAMQAAARDLLAATPAATESTDLADEPGFPADPDLAEMQAPTAAHAGSRSPDPQSRPGAPAGPDLAELKEMIRRKTGHTWGELPGHLRTEILQLSPVRYRDNYARLIQLYFRDIAAGSVRRESPED